MPNGMKTSYNNMCLEQKLVLILSGLNCDILIEEWASVMINICEYVYEVYRLRKKYYDLTVPNGIT